MKPAVHCLLVVLVFGVVIGEDQLGAIAHERGNVVRERRSPFLSFPGGGFGVGVRYDDTRYRSIPGFIFQRYEGYYGSRIPDAYVNISD
uniref:Secreted protein n=1 Tax=Anopheles coluzzii TaxID=1518534 RepID=A0A9I3BDA2_ANOCL